MLRTLRSKVLAILSLLMLVSLGGVGVSFWITQQVNSKLEEINHRAVPMQRELAQLTSDSELLRREMEHSLGFTHWRDPRWKPRRVPVWALEIHRSTLERFKAEYFNSNLWQEWYTRLNRMDEKLGQLAEVLFLKIQEQNFDGASELYPEWMSLIDMIQKEGEWAKREMDRETRNSFQLAQNSVKSLRTALQILLMVVIGVSLLILWMGERALRPIGHLRKIVQHITERGSLTQDDRADLPEFSISQQDEVSDLAREFHQMATSLLEREKTVHHQKGRLEDQNRLLMQMGALNQSILKSIPSLLLVCDREGCITQCNQKMVERLGAFKEEDVVGKNVLQFPMLERFFLDDDDQAKVKKIEPTHFLSEGQSQAGVFAGSLFPLWVESDHPSGRILLLDDMTESLELQKRLQQAEHLAAVGRMSAQVAHEVGNPLHSIGLEAELALDLLSQPEVKNAQVISLRHSIQTILASVERLQKIIQNYLRLSKLSPDRSVTVDFKAVIERVLATYANSCEDQGVKVNWRFEGSAIVKGDPDLLEYALGNLMRNSLQALEVRTKGKGRIDLEMKAKNATQLQLFFSDNGPGLPAEVQTNLFKPFFTTKAQGTGLGLSFVKKVFEDMGGTFSLGDSQVNIGTVFIGTLPLDLPVICEKEFNA